MQTICLGDFKFRILKQELYTISFNHPPKSFMETHSLIHHAALKMDLENLGYLTIFKRAACGHDDINCVQAAVDVLEGLLLHVSR